MFCEFFIIATYKLIELSLKSQNISVVDGAEYLSITKFNYRFQRLQYW